MKIGHTKIRVSDIPMLLFTLIQLCMILTNLVYPTDAINRVMFVVNYCVGFSAILSLAFRNIAKHFLAITFLGCYLLFLMAQKPFMDHYNVYLTFVWTELNTKQYSVFATILFAGLSICYYAYIYFCECYEKNRVGRYSVPRNNFTPISNARKDVVIDNRRVERICTVILLLTLPFAIYMQTKIVLAKSAMDYTQGYLVNVDIPSYVKIGYYLFTSVLLIFLSIKPSRRKMFLAIAVYLILEGGLQLLQGRRALFAATLLFTVWYLIKYFDIKKFNAKTLILVGAVAIGMVALFIVVEQTRDGATNSLSLGTLANFLISTGGSDSVIANTIVRKQDFPQPGWKYLFDPLVNNFVGNILSGKPSVPQGVQYLEQYNSFAHWISYLSEESLYLSGHGMGTSFLAEAYLAFGMVGVFLCTTVVGWIINKINCLRLGENPIGCSILLFLARQLFTLPRGSVFGWFGDSIYLFVAFVFVGALYVCLDCRKQELVINKNRAVVRRIKQKVCKTVTIGVIAYNEEKYLPDLLMDVLKQTYPRSLTELILVDSGSTDRTKLIMEKFRDKYTSEYLAIKVFDNPRKIQPAGWNIVIQCSKADVIIRVDAHAKIPADFVEKNMQCINSGEFVCGGPRENIVDEDTPWKKMLLNAELSLFGSGIAAYRRETDARKYVKSLFHGAYRREVFLKCGLFNENLVRTEDNEIHYRIRQNGFKICYDPTIKSYYHTRNTLPRMIMQKYQNGLWIGKTLKVCPGCISLFHLVPLAFVGALAGCIIFACLGISWMLLALLLAYGAFVAFNTIVSMIQNKNLMDVVMPLVFFGMHMAYGLGTIVGLLGG